MHPIAFYIGNFPVYAYGVLVALACLLAGIWLTSRARQFGENPDTYMTALLVIVLSGFVGARLLHVIYYPEMYTSAPLKILFDRGGLVWYGGVFAATASAVVTAKILKLQWLRFADALAPTVALGLAVGRVGCLMAGCCYGAVCMLPWAVVYPEGHATHPHTVHPVQIYESLMMLALIVLMLYLERRQASQGTSVSLFLMGAGVIRFVMEFWRGDVVYWLGGLLTASQVMSLVLIIAGVVLWVSAVKQNRSQLLAKGE